jgi:hypothetical protein
MQRVRHLGDDQVSLIHCTSKAGHIVWLSSSVVIVSAEGDQESQPRYYGFFLRIGSNVKSLLHLVTSHSLMALLPFLLLPFIVPV